MQGHELRKLITTFLVLALLAGSASLAITSLVRQQSEGPAAKLAEETGTQVPKIGDRALVEDIASTRIQGYDLAAEFSPSTDPDDNYTDGLAKSLAYNFVKANPEGPDLTSGTGILPPGNLQDVMEEYVTEAALSPTTYAIDKSRVKVAKNYTEGQAATYLATVTGIFESATSSKGLGGIIARAGSQPDEAAIEATNFYYADAQEKLYDTVVPAPARELHEAALAYLELNRKLTDLDYTTDPLKAVVFATKFPEFEAMEQARLRIEVEKLQERMPELFANAQQPFMLASILGINEARAGGIAVTDWKHTIINILNGTAQFGTWGQLIVSQAKSIALQILKNQLIGRLIQQTVKWVQGGGKPQFITNWKAFLKDTATGAANQFISAVAPRLCQNLRAFTTDFLRDNVANTISGSRDPYARLTCTLDQIVQNVKNFYNDFRSGGWLGLASLVLQPQNNIWGALIVTHEAAITQAAQAQEAAKTDAVANEGYKGLNRCADVKIETINKSELPRYQKDPNFFGLVGCSTISSGSSPSDFAYCYQNPTGTAPSGASCEDVLSGGEPQQEEKCEIKMCSADGLQKITPGAFVGHQLDKAIGTTGESIVNANDLAGLVAALVDAAITKLTTLATGGLLGLFGGSSDSGGSGGSGSGTGGGSTGGGPSQDVIALKAQASQFVSSYESRVTTASTDNAAWQGLASNIRPLLSSVAQTCPAYESDANQRLGALDRIAARVDQDRQAIEVLRTRLTDARASIAAATDAITVADLISSLDGIGSEIATISTRIATRNGQIQGLQNDAQANLQDRACSTPLTPLDE